uniref:Mating factor a1.2 n=1 Tax=Ustilago xerochloae TaxID=249492 RepID=H2CZ31_9BASI|nr:mating factor a1.2 [Ustilago xerochloae]AEY62542.1 mating factor a3.2 [Ustilago xerochloae]
MFSIFTQPAQTSVSETQESPANELAPVRGKSGSGLGYSTCVVA